MPRVGMWSQIRLLMWKSCLEKSRSKLTIATQAGNVLFSRNPINTMNFSNNNNYSDSVGNGIPTNHDLRAAVGFFLQRSVGAHVYAVRFNRHDTGIDDNYRGREEYETS